MAQKIRKPMQVVQQGSDPQVASTPNNVGGKSVPMNTANSAAPLVKKKKGMAGMLNNSKMMASS